MERMKVENIISWSNESRKYYFMINLYKKMLLTQQGLTQQLPDHKQEVHPAGPLRLAIQTLRKQAYSNLQKILPPKNENF